MGKIFIKNKFGKTVSLVGSMAARAREQKKRLNLIQTGGDDADFIFESFIADRSNVHPLSDVEQHAAESSYFSAARLTPEAIEYGIAMENISTLPTDLLVKFIECKKNYIGSLLYRLIEERPKLYNRQVTPQNQYMYVNFISLYTVIIACELAVFDSFLEKIKNHPLHFSFTVFYNNAVHIVTRSNIFQYARNDIDNIEYAYITAAIPMFYEWAKKFSVRRNYSISYMTSIMYNKMLLTCNLIAPNRMTRILEYRKVYYKKIGLLNNPLLLPLIKYEQIIIDTLALCNNNNLAATLYGKDSYNRILLVYKRSDTQSLIDKDIIDLKLDMKLIKQSVPDLSKWFS